MRDLGRIPPQPKFRNAIAEAKVVALPVSAVLVSLIALALLFWRDAVGAINVWIVSPTFNHCFLVLPLCVFLIWTRRDQIAELKPQSDYRALIPILFLTAAWLVISIMSILELEQFIVLTIAQCIIFGLLGAQYYRRLLGPFLYLYFLVPSGAIFIPALQSFTAKFAVTGLHLLGIPVFSNGAIIDIPAGSFAVAEACAGLRFLIASVAFGVFYSFLTYKSFTRRAIFIGFSVGVPIIANGFRALGLIAAAEWVGSPSSVMADHLIYGWVFFSFVLIILIFVGQRFSDQNYRKPAPQLAATPEFALPSIGTVFVLLLGLALASAGPAVKLALRPAGQMARLPALPGLAPPWTADVRSARNWAPLVTGAAQTFQDSWQNGGQRFDRYVAIYGLPGQDGALARSSNRDADDQLWTFDTSRSAVLVVNGARVPVRISTWYRGPLRRVVWSYFEIGGQAAAGGVRTKLKQFSAYLRRNRCLSAFVAVSATGEGATDEDAAAVLSANQPLTKTLCGPKAPTR